MADTTIDEDQLRAVNFFKIVFVSAMEKRKKAECFNS